MSIEEQLVQDFLTLPEDKKREVIDFIEFLKTRTSRQIENAMDDIIKENHEALEKLSE